MTQIIIELADHSRRKVFEDVDCFVPHSLKIVWFQVLVASKSLYFEVDATQEKLDRIERSETGHILSFY